MKEIKAIFETKREQLMFAWLDEDKRNYINDGYVFAISERLYPYFHIDTSKADVFEDVYEVPKSLVKKVIERIDEIWVDDPQSSDLEFYNLEHEFGGRGLRIELIQIIRYCAISGRFSADTYNKIMSNAPVEANFGLNDPLEEGDLVVSGY